MIKPQNHPKQLLVAKIAAEFQHTQFVALGNYTALSAARFNELRRALIKHQAQLKVYKNTLLKRAWIKTHLADLGTHLTGPKCLVKSDQDGFPLFALLAQFSQKFKTLDWLGGFWNGEILDQTTFKTLSQIPSRSVLYQKLLMLLNNPLAHLHGHLQVLAQMKHSAKQ